MFTSIHARRVLLVAGLAAYALPLGRAERRAAGVESEGNPGEGDVRQAAGDRRAHRDGAAQQRRVHQSEPRQALLPQDGERRAGVDRGVRQAALSPRRRGDRLQGQSRARAHDARRRTASRCSIPTTGATRTIETPKGALVSSAVWSPDGKSIALHRQLRRGDADLRRRRRERANRCRSRRRRCSPRASRRFDWTADGKNIVTVLLPDNRGAEPKRAGGRDGPARPHERRGQAACRTATTRACCATRTTRICSTTTRWASSR